MNDHTNKFISSLRLNDETIIGPFRTVLMDIANVICPDGEAENWVFRGVSNINHKLEPSIARQGIRNPSIVLQIEQMAFSRFRSRSLSRLGAENILYLREAITQMDGRFRKHRPEAPSGCQSLGEAYVWSALMQHSGVPTRLLDWTESPWIALYFASISELDADGALYALNRRRLQDTYKNRDLAPVDLLTAMEKPSTDLIHIVELPYAFGRIENQRGLFTVSESATADHAPIIRRALRRSGEFVFWLIPRETKLLFRRYLASMNIAQEFFSQSCKASQKVFEEI